MRKPSYYERFQRMTPAQRRAEVAEFDKEDLTPGEALPPEQKKQWRAAKRRGRPRKPAADKAARVLVTLPPDLLREADTYAKKHGKTRAGLIADGLRAVMAP